jgi:NAD(P)-dependent dehydrogenase (short-subunit alcohol dehydrogenase family)
MDFELTNKVALVTGGASGFGAAIAGALAREGCRVVIADLDRAAAEGAAARFAANKMPVTAAAFDVGDSIGAARAIDGIVGLHGQIDILVTSAGVLKTGSVLDSTPEDWERVSRVNLTGVLNCVRAVAPAMQARNWGRIVNLASVSAMRGGGSVGNVLYGTTKAGVVALTMGLARELGPSGITVNAIAPGVADTAMTKTYLSEETRRRIVERVPLRRLATTDDVAHLVCFLASERSSYITGTVIPVDGGILTT